MSKEVFVRKATGLTRPFGFWDTLIIAAGMLNMGSGTLLVFSSSIAFGPSYNFVLSLFLAWLLNLFIVTTYAMITVAFPRSGGDYVFVSRTINPALGFANNFFWTVVAILGISWNCIFMGTTAVGPSLAVGGAVLKSDYLSSLASVATQPLWAFLIGLLTLLFTMSLLIVHVKWLKAVNLVTFVVGMIMVAAWIGVLAMTPQSAFINSFNSFAQRYTNNPDSYHLIIQQAKSNGLTISADWNSIWLATLVSLPISYFTLGGANIINFFSGEIKDVDRTGVWAPIIPLCAIFLLTVALGYVFFNTTGYEFMAALSWLAFNVPSSYALPTAPYLPLLADIAAPNMAMVMITLVGMICWLYLLAMAYYLIATRNLFAWSYDGVIPTWFSETHKKYHTPVRSVLTISLLATIGVAFYDFFSGAFYATNFTTAFNSAFLIGCASAAVFPFIKKETFEAQSAFVRKRIAGIPWMTIWGTLGVLAIVIMDIFVVQHPGYAGIPTNMSNISLVILLAVFLCGFIYFWAAKAIQKGRGLDLSLVFKEIPPS